MHSLGTLSVLKLPGDSNVLLGLRTTEVPYRKHTPQLFQQWGSLWGLLREL